MVDQSSLVPRLRMNGAAPPILLHAFISCTRKFYYVVDRAFLRLLILDSNLCTIILFLWLYSSTCFGHPCAHLQEDQLYIHNNWLVKVSFTNLPTVRPKNEMTLNQLLWMYSWSSWRWAHGCPKHVEEYNQRNKIIVHKLESKINLHKVSLPFLHSVFGSHNGDYLPQQH